MKAKIRCQVFIAVALLAAMVAGCGTLVSCVSTSSQDWQFVQSVGGIAVGRPFREKGHVHLPVRCDVSGTETITIHPVVINSALVCKPPRVQIRNGRIFLTIRTGLPDDHYPGPCPDADLGAIPAGDYPVLYLSPNGDQHPIGAICVPR